MIDQAIVFATLIIALLLFVDGRVHYDVVGLLALLALVFTGIIGSAEAFTGFGHPAVITVGAVLVISRALYESGLVDVMVRWLSQVGDRPSVQVATLTGMIAVFSALMNNVGALALLMPVALQMTRRTGNPPSVLLMPLAFGSLLGGMVTLIGTPPNIIVSTFRADAMGEPFRMFDFAPVGIGIAAAGILFMSVVGWRLIPKRPNQASPLDLFHVEDYLTEVRVPADSGYVGKLVRDLEELTGEDIAVVGLVRRELRHPAPSSFEVIDADDIFIVEADPEELKELLDSTGFELVGDRDLSADVENALGSEDVSLAEAVVMPDAFIEGRTARSIHLHARYGVNLLGVSRVGRNLAQRLGRNRLRSGDVLLLQGRADTLRDAIVALGCLPLGSRDIRLGQRRRILVPMAIFGTALVLAATGVLAVQISLGAAAVAMVLLKFLSVRDAYDAIEWPVIVLLAVMIPVGRALETTGGSDLIAENLLDLGGQGSPEVALVVLVVVTSLLSDVINNAAATILMAPIAIGTAQGLGVSVDSFLMGIAIGASAAFLTPIGHQSNTLVMGPGGYRFGDYWRLGLPLKLLVIAVATPLILLLWPLGP